MIKRFIAVCFMLFMGVVHALDLELTQGINAALPIAVTSFSGDQQAELTGVIENDLRMSGQFKLIQGYGGQQSMSSWKQAGADSVLSGS
ncbi:MAG: Tol-Pal system beta propeller repeat protein TolB, partial [Firmicutes bacterium]|nr:Tol-Pal system beta propeller repeat protein TolB [Bacillota bacterium]